MILVVGAGGMAQEYVKVLNALKEDFLVVGRSEKSAENFFQKTGIKAICGGIEAFFLQNSKEVVFSSAIVTTGVEELASASKFLIEKGIKNILVEKPAGLTSNEVKALSEFATKNSAKVYVAYNRRFFASVIAAKKIIDEDGGVQSFNFELTEWGHVIKDNPKADEVKDNWFLANTTHVADMAYFLGGFPKELSCYATGGLDWHKRSHNYSGAGISNSGALFSYNGNWAAPGRWSVEMLTNKHRLIFRPMEKLQIQELGSVAQEFVEIDDSLDQEFKPGLYNQVSAFLNQETESLCCLHEHSKHVEIYTKMAGY